MPSPTDVSPPERLADAEGKLPEEIVKAITDLIYQARSFYCVPDAWEIAQSRAALAATILARLTAAESAREAANFMAESWKATAEAEAEIGNERAAEARAALARAERAEKALDDWHLIEAVPEGIEVLVTGGVSIMGGRPLGRRVAVVDDRRDLYREDNGKLRGTSPTMWTRLPEEPSAALAHPATAEET